MDQLNCVVRIEDGEPIIFSAIEGNPVVVECFTFKDGHNESTVAYMRSLPLASAEVTQQTLKRYQSHLNSLPIDSVEVKAAQRLKLR